MRSLKSYRGLIAIAGFPMGFRKSSETSKGITRRCSVPERVQGRGKLTAPRCTLMRRSFTYKAGKSSLFPALPATRRPRAALHNSRHGAGRFRRSLHTHTCKFRFQCPTVLLHSGMPSRKEGTTPTPAPGVSLSFPDDPHIPVPLPFFFLS